MQVIKRNGQIVDFDQNKIVIAIKQAMQSPQGEFVENQAEEIAKEIFLKNEKTGKNEISVYQIEDLVDRKSVV